MIKLKPSSKAGQKLILFEPPDHSKRLAKIAKLIRDLNLPEDCIDIVPKAESVSVRLSINTCLIPSIDNLLDLLFILHGKRKVVEMVSARQAPSKRKAQRMAKN